MNKKLQYIVLFLDTFFKRHKKIIILSFLIGFLITVISNLTFPYLAATLGTSTVRIGVVGQYSTETLPFTMQQKISLGLTRLDTSGIASPSAASSIEVNDAGTVYTINLRKDIRWHDGKSLRADDISYTLRGAEIHKKDPTTLEIVLKDPYAPLPVLLSKPLLRDGAIGLGSYEVSRINYKGESLTGITLTPFANDLPVLSYKFYNTSADAILAFKLGELDRVEDLSDAQDIAAWKNAEVVTNTLYNQYVALFFNLRGTLFKDKEIRQALAYALPPIDKYEKALTPISPLSWAYSKRVRLYNYDTEAASKILSKSPLASDSATLTISTFPSLISTAQIVKDAWEKVGVPTKIKVVSEIPIDYDVFLFTQGIPPDPDQYQYWESGQDTNITGYVNLKIDKLLEDGRRKLDLDERKKIYSDFQRYLVDDAPVIFLYYPKSYTVVRK